MAIPESNPPDFASQEHKRFRAAIYARVSTANNSQDPTMQTRELREYCSRRGWQVAGEFVDAGISGTKEHRPALDRLLSLCQKRSVDAVVVCRPARAGPLLAPGLRRDGPEQGNSSAGAF